jgi:hypothetical protein
LPLTYVGPLHSHSYPAPISSLAVASVTCITQTEQVMSGSTANAGKVRPDTCTLQYEAHNDSTIHFFQFYALFINKIKRQNARKVCGNIPHSNNRLVSVSRKRLVDFMSMVT